MKTIHASELWFTHMKLKLNININYQRCKVPYELFSVAELMFIMNRIFKFLSEMECQLYQ